MLEFFRKYQRYVYLVVTVVIVISFSFFGTYSTIVSNPIRDQVVFTAVDGTNIKRSELDEMVIFISTDNYDKLAWGGVWGPNFLNDGVVRTNLLATGLGQILAMNYMDDLQNDLQNRLQKEKNFVPYAHPQAKFISADTAWAKYIPEMKENFDALRRAQSGSDAEALKARVGLYLNEGRFPANFLRQVLLFQEKQFNWVAHDPALEREDLSLFGYHTLEDWFGPRFVRLAAEFIINAAHIAEQKGYDVSKEEALADLLRNSEISYQQNINNQNLGVANNVEYFNEQLRRLGMDQNQAVKVWRDVLLFKRLFNDVGNSVFVDPLSFNNFSAFADESVNGVVYSLPQELQFQNFRAMQKFEVYLNAISKRDENGKDPLALPTEFLTVAEVSKKYPELVQKRYLIQVSQINKDTLQARVSVRDTWNWEVDNWDELKREFPEVAVKKVDNRDERFAALESLDDVTRERVDSYARKQIVNAHPEWLNEALEKAREKTMTIGLNGKTASPYFIGLESSQALMKQLDKADEPFRFTADNQHYYRITLLDKSPQEEILSFAEATRSGALDKILDKELKSFYSRNREKHAALFQKEDMSWKAFEDVQESVADLYFDQQLKAIAASYEKSNASKEKLTSASLAPLRFYGYMGILKTQMEKDPSIEEKIVAPLASPAEDNKLQARGLLSDQWKLIKNETKISRAADESNSEIFKMAAGSWSKLMAPANGNLTFVQVKGKGDTSEIAMANKRLDRAHTMIAHDAQRAYMAQVVKEIKDKNAISLQYLNQPIETVEPELPVNSYAE